MSFDVNDYLTDFDFLSELSTYLQHFIRNDLQHADTDMLKTGIYSTLHDGRSVRIVIPHHCKFSDITLDDDLFCMGFIGYAKPFDQISETVRNEVWDIDSTLMSKFSDFPDILAYISAERIKGGDWSNLVLIKNAETIITWRDSCAHLLARKLSVHYYSEIRIHRGRVQRGKINVDRTVLLDYTSTPIKRTEIKWSER